MTKIKPKVACCDLKQPAVTCLLLNEGKLGAVTAGHLLNHFHYHPSESVVSITSSFFKTCNFCSIYFIDISGFQSILNCFTQQFNIIWQIRKQTRLVLMGSPNIK